MMPYAFILGGTGQIGRATAEHLRDGGWSVTLAHRGQRPVPPSFLARGIKVVTVDRRQDSELARALSGGADLLVDAVAYGPEDACQLLTLQRSLDAIVVISSASVYCDGAGRTLDEAAETGFPRLPDPISERQIYGRTRSSDLFDTQGGARTRASGKSGGARDGPPAGRDQRTRLAACKGMVVRQARARSPPEDTVGLPRPEPLPYGLGREYRRTDSNGSAACRTANSEYCRSRCPDGGGDWVPDRATSRFCRRDHATAGHQLLSAPGRAH
ncbi:MAG: NAD(P)H-binding protein, partial [Methylobacteriaceae bacterium]|nr:NAD(P)H-binding protein [Methylobacteriaceae bacterium]